MPSPPALVHPMENSSAADAGSNQRPTKFSYSSSVTVSKAVAILVLIILLLLLLLAISIPIVVYKYATCSNTADGQQATAAPAVSPSPQVGKNLNYRLPRNLIPLRYTVHLKTYIPSKYVTYDSSSEFTFDGNISILMMCNYTTDVVILHTKKLNITTSSLSLFELDDNKNRRDSKRIEINTDAVEELDDLEQIRIPLKTNLIASKLYRIYANYRGELSSDLAGFYRSSYEEDGSIKWLAVTQFQPTSARRALPCFDEPDFKAVFSVKLSNPKNMVALSNMMDLKRQDEENGWSTTYFKDSPKMSSYLLAFLISEFSFKSKQTVKGVTFRIWARPSQIEFTSLALEKGPKLLEMYEDYFNISFPLEKQDMVAIPDFDAGAMENWGLITYRESLLLANNGSSSSTSRQKLVEVMAHELAHQWFGNLVTMDWWDDIWLNEGFSMYMQYMGADHAFGGNFKMTEQFVINSLHISMEYDQMTTSHPLHVQVNNPTEIFQIFDSITYDKGASVIRMLRDVVGEKVFQKALSQYLKEYKYSNANHHDLWDSLTKVVQTDLTTRDWNNEPLNITEFMTSWTEQMGYPLVTVERNYQRRTVTMNQQRFKIDESIPDNPKFANNTFGYKWYIPIKYQTGNSPTIETTWLKPGQELTLPRMMDSNTWVLINHGVPGFFRTNYDLTNWQLLRSQLLTNNQVIDNRNRAQLIEDAFTLARVGKLSYNVALSLTEYMPNENTYTAWHACLSNFKWIKERLIQTEYTPLTDEYFRRLVESAYHRAGYESQSEITDDVSHKLRATIWQYSCEFGLPHCIHVATKLFKEYKENCTDPKAKSSSECNKLSPNLRQIIYCTGIAESKSADDWEFLWKKYVFEDFSVEKLHMLYGLSCSRNPSLIKKYLDNASEGTGIRNADVGIAFILVSQNPIGMNMLWNYVKKNWNKFVSKFDLSHSLSAIVKAATVGFTTERQLKEMTKFIQDNAKSLGSSKLAFDQRVEETKANIAWMEKYSTEVISWFKEQASSVKATL